MSMHVPDSSECCSLFFLLGAILQGSWFPRNCQTLHQWCGMRALLLLNARMQRPIHQNVSDTGSLDASDGSFRRWAKRGLRDQAGIYTAPFHRSELKWVIGLPAVTLGLIAIDKHASGPLSRNGTSASTDISDVGLFATAGSGWGVAPRWRNTRQFMPSKPECWGPRPWPTAGWCMRRSS